MQDDDVRRLKTIVQAQLNFELATVPEIIDFACEIKPDMAMLVPERRQEVTTEGGLDVRGQFDSVSQAVAKIRAAGIRTSAFIDADVDQIAAARDAGFDVCEIHTGPYAERFAEFRDPTHDAVLTEIRKIGVAGEAIRSHDMQFNAGHGLNYRNVQPIAALPGVNELHIGHGIVSRAVFVGLREAVREMKRLMVDAIT